MKTANRLRVQHALRRAEGYLELGMAQHALDEVARIEDPGGLRGRAKLAEGYALRFMGRYAEAIPPLVEAAELEPADYHVRLALGWCYKRVDRLDLAIEALEQAAGIAPEEALIHYNLACYWSLAGDKEHTLDCLTRALELSPDYRDMIPAETDFDTFRHDPDFQAITSLSV